MRPMAPLTRRTAVAALLVAHLVACGGEPRGTAEFCEELRSSTALLTDTSDPAALVETYRRLDSRTPLRIKDEWREITLLLERIVSFDSTDAEATQAIIADALRARASLDAVAAWAESTCKVTLARPSATPPPSDTVALTDGPDTTPFEP